MSDIAAVQRYWNQGIHNVPEMTGAATLMDGADIKEHAEKLGFALPFESVVDVGCGTGRLSRFVCYKYLGVDVSEDAVAYCRSQNIPAIVVRDVIEFKHLIVFGQPEWITCLSVFTHIDRGDRLLYLDAFARKYADNLLVDIIPGDGSGNIELWTSDWDLFQQDLKDTGWSIVAWYDRIGPSGPTHRYVRAER